MTPAQLENTLRGMNLKDMRVHVEGRPGRLVAEVTSPEFTGQNEGKRQQRVWEYLLGTLSDYEQVEVEFVFTRTPAEESGAVEQVED